MDLERVKGLLDSLGIGYDESRAEYAMKTDCIKLKLKDETRSKVIAIGLEAEFIFTLPGKFYELWIHEK